MKRAKREDKPKPAEVPEDPTLRVDILVKRLLEEVMTKHCTDPALVFVYARFKPGIEQVLEEFVGPVKVRRRRVR